MDKRKVNYPVERRVSKDVRALVGFRDDRVEIKVKSGIPLVGEITLSMKPEDMAAVEQVVRTQKAWMTMAKFEREMKGAK